MSDDAHRTPWPLSRVQRRGVVAVLAALSVGAVASAQETPPTQPIAFYTRETNPLRFVIDERAQAWTPGTLALAPGVHQLRVLQPTPYASLFTLPSGRASVRLQVGSPTVVPGAVLLGLGIPFVLAGAAAIGGFSAIAAPMALLAVQVTGFGAVLAGLVMSIAGGYVLRQRGLRITVEPAASTTLSGGPLPLATLRF